MQPLGDNAGGKIGDHQGMTFNGILGPWPLSVCFLATLRWACLLCHMLPAMMCWLTTGPTWWGHMTMNWNFWNYESRKIYLRMRRCQIFCHSDTKLINTENWSWEGWPLTVCFRGQWKWFVGELGKVNRSGLESWVDSRRQHNRNVDRKDCAHEDSGEQGQLEQG